LDTTLRLELADSHHKGSVAGAVLLGAALAAGLPPLAADRASRAVKSACMAVEGPVEVAIAPAHGSGSIVTLRLPAGTWPDSAARALDSLHITADGEVLRFLLRRPALRLADPRP
jgi:hypothetical protein